MLGSGPSKRATAKGYLWRPGPPSLAFRLYGYIPALAAFALAGGLHYCFLRILGQKFAGIFFVYLMAMLIAAWCGYGPGLVVIALTLALPNIGAISNYRLIDLTDTHVTFRWNDYAHHNKRIRLRGLKN
jgi:hypothetical protein